MMPITNTVKQLLIINVIFYIGSNLVGKVAYTLFSLSYFQNPDFQVWQIITHMFMHAELPNVYHIVFNMMGLYMFGSALEHFWGAKRFIFFYITCGLGAALLHMGVCWYEFQKGLDLLVAQGHTESYVIDTLSKGLVDTRWVSLMPVDVYVNFKSAFSTNVVGASGALYGIIVAFAFMFPNAEMMLLFLPFPIKAKYFVPILVGLDLFSGVTGFSIFGGNIAHFAHVGGALFGFILMWYWRNNKYNHNRWN